MQSPRSRPLPPNFQHPSSADSAAEGFAQAGLTVAFLLGIPRTEPLNPRHLVNVSRISGRISEGLVSKINGFLSPSG